MHQVSAGVGFHSDALAALLLHRWLPTSLAALALAAVTLWAARARTADST
jgi:hypothetical protein